MDATISGSPVSGFNKEHHAGFRPSGLGSPLPLHNQDAAAIGQGIIQNSYLSRLCFPKCPSNSLS